MIIEYRENKNTILGQIKIVNSYTKFMKNPVISTADYSCLLMPVLADCDSDN